MAPHDDDRKARLIASRERGSIKRGMATFRSLYAANAIATALLAVLSAEPLFRAIYGVAFIASVVGIGRVRSEPFLWTLGAAVFWTLQAGLRVVQGGVVEFWFFVVCFWAACCWLMLPSARRMRELVRKHPEQPDPQPA